MLAAAQSPPMTRTPARPVTALRHALWRRRLRSARSSSRTGRARDRPSPNGTAAALTKRSAGRTSVRPLADAHAETTEVSASCVATVAAYERAVTTPVTTAWSANDRGPRERTNVCGAAADATSSAVCSACRLSTALAVPPMIAAS